MENAGDYGIQLAIEDALKKGLETKFIRLREPVRVRFFESLQGVSVSVSCLMETG